ncbi:MAG: hypothetical protein ABI683_04460 [Ginsengibacter sp.]
MEGKLRKYKTNFTLSGKGFWSCYILQDVSEWQFVFVNTNKSNYPAIKSAIVGLLKKNGVNYNYESSASMGADYYRWMKKFEINIVGNNSYDKFLEVNFYHRN